MNKKPVIINGVRLFLDGYLCVRTKVEIQNRTYWDCQKVRYKECKARAITVTAMNGEIRVLRGPDESVHSLCNNAVVSDRSHLSTSFQSIGASY